MSFLTKLKGRIKEANHPPDGQAYLDRAASHRNQGNYSVALDDLEAAIRLLPEGPDRVAAYANRARVYRAMENWEAAAADLAYVLKEAPKAGFAYADRAFVLLMQGDNEGYVKDLDRAIALLPDGKDKAMAYTNRGLAKQTMGDLPGALADFERAIVNWPEFKPAYEQRDTVARLLADATPPAEVAADPAGLAAELQQHARECEQQGNLIDALASYTRILELTPRDPVIFHRRGITHCKLAMGQEALDDLDWAISLRARFPAAITERGLTLALMGELENAMVAIDEALALDPGYAIAHLNKSFVHRLAGRLQEAWASIDMAVHLEPNNAEYRAGRGDIYANLGQFDSARRDFQAYLDALPEGPRANAIRNMLSQIPDKTDEQPELATPWPAEALWQDYVVLDRDTTIEQMIQRVQHGKAYYVVLPLVDGRWAVESVYGQAGLRDRLTTIADVIGRTILPVRLGQFPDLWRPCVPASPASSEEDAWKAVVESGGRTLLWEEGEIIGVLEGRPTQHYPDSLTALFGPASAFDREQSQDQHHNCPNCQATFAYYAPVLGEGKLIDYACPMCAASPIPAWIEARMRPGLWSQGGFLAQGEMLHEVIASDQETLDQVGVTHEQIAAALDRLLDTAVASYQAELIEAIDYFGANWVATETYALNTVAKPTMRYDLNEVEDQLHQGRLPVETAGARNGDFQVLLQPYLGYQYCPFTALCRPWSDEVLGIPIQVLPTEQVNVVTVETGLALPCQAGQTYRYSDIDFLLINRGTGDYLAGPGLIVHLIRDHRFFEGPASPYRVDPVTAARVLGLLQAN